MNNLERKMVELLARGREAFGYLSVKAEFEAEGTRVDELLRLVEIARRAQVDLTVKIGGCEAVRDLLEARQIGVRYIVAPMVETPYALSKFVLAKNTVYQAEERRDTDFLFNIETITGYNNRQGLAEQAVVSDGVNGMVFGRSDFCGSLGLSKDAINDPEVTTRIVQVAEVCRKNSLDLVVGGGVSIDSIPALKEIRAIHLTRFETRKVVFSSVALEQPGIEEGFLNALRFELLWLENKQNYYKAIAVEDEKRINTLKNRWKI